MKKLITALAFLVFTISVIAAQNGMSLQFPNGSCGGPSVAINKAGALYVKAANNWTKQFGYYTFDKSGNIIAKEIVPFKYCQKTKVGDFEAGDNVGFWMKKWGKTYYTDLSKNPQGSWSSAVNHGKNIYMGLDADGYTYPRMDAEFHISYEEAPPAPTGQPLPGVMISLLSGLFMAGGFIAKKKKRA